MKTDQAPTIMKGSRDGTVEHHPAFGQIGASRVSGGTTLYGSDFVHHNFVSITIDRSELHRDLSRDWHHGKEGLIEVHLSEAQWATFVSSMNVGNGVPCTLNRVAGESMPTIPIRKTENIVREELDATLKGITNELQQAIDAINGELGASVSNKKREAILEHLLMAQRKVSDSLPFAARSFSEHIETTVEKAKVEVNAYMTNVIQRTGLAALQEGTGPLQLESGETHDR